MENTTFYTLSSILDDWSRECGSDRETFFDLIERNIPPLNISSNPWHITTPNGCECTIDGVFFDEEAEIAITRSPEPIQLSEHELLKFLEEE